MTVDDWLEIPYKDLSEDQKKFIELGWKLLEYKCVYYRPKLVHPYNLEYCTISDATYDLLEGQYKAVCVRLGEIPTASDMVGFDLDRPSCKMVVRKLGKPRRPPGKSE